MEEPKWTHKGWMMFCPIKLAEPYSGAPTITARWLVLEPLLWLAETVQGLVILFCSIFIKDYDPHFFFKVTGEITSKSS